MASTSGGNAATAYFTTNKNPKNGFYQSTASPLKFRNSVNTYEEFKPTVFKPQKYSDPLRKQPTQIKYIEPPKQKPIPLTHREYEPPKIDPLTGKPYGKKKPAKTMSEQPKPEPIPEPKDPTFPTEWGSRVGTIKRTLDWDLMLRPNHRTNVTFEDGGDW